MAATGHSIAMHGETLRRQLADFAAHFDAMARPKTGRYTQQPATADGSGVTSLPPPLKSWLKMAAPAGLALGAGVLLVGRKKKSRAAKARKPTARNGNGRYRTEITLPNPAADQPDSSLQHRMLETQYP